MAIILMTIGGGILLMVNGGYSISGYWWLLVVIILLAIGRGILLLSIGRYFIGEYWWLLVAIVLMVVGSYFIVDYYKIIFHRLLLAILGFLP